MRSWSLALTLIAVLLLAVVLLFIVRPPVYAVQKNKEGSNMFPLALGRLPEFDSNSNRASNAEFEMIMVTISISMWTCTPTGLVLSSASSSFIRTASFTFRCAATIHGSTGQSRALIPNALLTTSGPTDLDQRRSR